MTCDSDMKIMDVIAYPGTVYDQFIWTYSAQNAMQSIYQDRMGKFSLIGDAGCILEQWLLTPLAHADEGTPEFRYTRAHCRARSVIERLRVYMELPKVKIKAAPALRENGWQRRGEDSLSATAAPIWRRRHNLRLVQSNEHANWLLDREERGRAQLIL
ncbi:uncharacterized protein LOC124172627 [Ischnura elegans]|uniref:uncharacterized protein LOC124172627 n=1 Tax=Ischnura elegans TaxID=197161 RepID=UPI001ED8AB11|nr:uncharacterized protein LOC124172627 [Ischnura elegans]